MGIQKELAIQYLTDNAGHRTGVVLSLEQFDELMEEIDDLAAMAERREEPTLTHLEVVEELKRDRLLD